MKARKNILIVDNNSELEQLVKEPLLKRFENSEMSAMVVHAKDGVEATRKFGNQKFDMVLIDSETPRLVDGGFVYCLSGQKNSHDAEVFVVSDKETSELPETLRISKLFKRPLNPQDLIETMISVLNQHHQEGDGSSSEHKHTVDVRIINAVINATINVFAQFGVKDIKMEKATPKSPHDPLMGEISSVVEIKSQAFQGHLCISFDKDSYLEVVSLMLMEEQTELTPDNQDAVGEINNIIFGNAKAEISHFGVQLTVPKVLLGSGKVVPCPEGSAGMIVPFTTPKGKFYITVVALLA